MTITVAVAGTMNEFGPLMCMSMKASVKCFNPEDIWRVVVTSEVSYDDFCCTLKTSKKHWRGTAIFHSPIYEANGTGISPECEETIAPVDPSELKRDQRRAYEIVMCTWIRHSLTVSTSASTISHDSTYYLHGEGGGQVKGDPDNNCWIVESAWRV